PGGALRLGVVIDRSRSIEAHAAQRDAALARLRELAGAGVQVDVYLTASAVRGEAPARTTLDALRPDDLRGYGGQNAGEILAQFSELCGGRAYDAVLVLTDDSAYEMGPSPRPIPLPGAPVWMVHLADALPLGYSDDVLEAVQASGGGVAGDFEEALGRMLVALSARGQAGVDIVDGYVWTVAQGDGAAAAAAPEEPGFAAFAARRLILAELARSRPEAERLALLDALHAVAIAQSIVTPYSSMIVLVNQRQQDGLDARSAQADRFDREHEAVGETPPSAPLVTGVPEPEEWLLIAVGAALLAWYAWRRRLARPPAIREV
ncbi:MAG: TIGR02921 family PEP-CTERM protein, partial [Chloroflexales bacterium]|nr:TIGR02921 family PEP-CTERM protein [Chloroflexales bacterium]